MYFTSGHTRSIKDNRPGKEELHNGTDQTTPNIEADRKERREALLALIEVTVDAVTGKDIKL